MLRVSKNEYILREIQYTLVLCGKLAGPHSTVLAFSIGYDVRFRGKTGAASPLLRI
jgi:hypothetical protein